MQISSHRLILIFLSVILRLTCPVLCLAYNLKIRTLLLMVAEQRSKLHGNPFLKVTEVQYLTLYARMKFHTNFCFLKQKGQQTQIWKKYALVDVYYMCATCLSLDVIGCFKIGKRISIIEIFYWHNAALSTMHK